MEEVSIRDKQLLADIEKHGWLVFKVLEDDKGPGFCYSVGLFKKFNHPEILIVGLDLDIAHELINEIGEYIGKGRNYESGRLYADILDDFNCLMLSVDKKYFREYFGYALWFYKSDSFPVLQCIYPTIKGIYPWEKEWPKDLIQIQPVLGNLTEVLS
jgi:hypothetical protein